MKTSALIVAAACGSLLIRNVPVAQEITGLLREEIRAGESPAECLGFHTSPPTRVYLRSAVGNLDITRNSSTDTYEAYFHIPVPFAEQVPILIEVESPYLIDYRFLHLSPPNVMIAARMNRGYPTSINWTAWVLVVENTYADLPAYVPMPTLEELPDSVRQWLAPTDCAQVDAPIVQQIAEEILGTTTNLIELAEDICDYCYVIPWEFPHTPMAFDAVYALNWGNSCTGHAHAGAALFRACGVPARSLLNIPTWYGGYFDMHWILDYFVPEYGWVRMETSTGHHPTYAQEEIVTLACNPEDEFPLFYPCGIEGAWHTSDPAMGMFNPSWGGAHHADNILGFVAPTEQIELAHSLTNAVFSYYSQYWGIILTPAQDAAFQQAFGYQTLALQALQEQDLDGCIAHLQSALEAYEAVGAAEVTTVFFDDFESGPGGWTHGGSQDEWELGPPTYGPVAAHSATNCWGTDLDGTYENGANCWLMSPPIDLTDRACAYLDFWVWNWVEDLNQGYVFDPLWMDITTDGETFLPLCSWMGGVNDDPEIPDVGGWSRLVLDLMEYTGKTVNVRFRFNSNGSDTQAGSYVDDVHVYARELDLSGVAEDGLSAQVLRQSQSRPNPFRAETTIRYALEEDSRILLEICSIEGKKVRRLIDGQVTAGHHAARWDGRDDRGSRVSAGIYFYSIQTDRGNRSGRIVLLD